MRAGWLHWLRYVHVLKIISNTTHVQAVVFDVYTFIPVDQYSLCWSCWCPGLYINMLKLCNQHWVQCIVDVKLHTAEGSTLTSEVKLHSVLAPKLCNSPLSTPLLCTNFKHLWLVIWKLTNYTTLWHAIILKFIMSVLKNNTRLWKIESKHVQHCFPNESDFCLLLISEESGFNETHPPLKPKN